LIQFGNPQNPTIVTHISLIIQENISNNEFYEDFSWTFVSVEQFRNILAYFYYSLNITDSKIIQTFLKKWILFFNAQNQQHFFTLSSKFIDVFENPFDIGLDHHRLPNSDKKISVKVSKRDNLQFQVAPSILLWLS
jgi:hypothetical protein